MSKQIQTMSLIYFMHRSFVDMVEITVTQKVKVWLQRSGLININTHD